MWFVVQSVLLGKAGNKSGKTGKEIGKTVELFGTIIAYLYYSISPVLTTWVNYQHILHLPKPKRGWLL